MTEKFERLEAEKQERIIKAALKEFAEKGYDQASTNTIVREAGIGKGMLFYYFTNKQELYYYLMDYSLSAIYDQFLSRIDDSIEDMIERMAHISRLKWKFYMKYPEVSHFLATFVLVDEIELPENLQKKYDSLYRSGHVKFYGMKKKHQKYFRDDIDAEKAYKLIEWAVNGYSENLLREFKGKNLKDIDLKPYWDEFDEYLAILKTCFYKREEKRG